MIARRHWQSPRPSKHRASGRPNVAHLEQRRWETYPDLVFDRDGIGLGEMTELPRRLEGADKGPQPGRHGGSRDCLRCAGRHPANSRRPCCRYRSWDAWRHPGRNALSRGIISHPLMAHAAGSTQGVSAETPCVQVHNSRPRKRSAVTETTIVRSFRKRGAICPLPSSSPPNLHA